jgi:uroporphyrinogen-III synthase
MTLRTGNIIIAVRPADRAFVLPPPSSFDILMCPSLGYQPTVYVLPPLQEVDGLLVTSARALEALGNNITNVKSLPLYIVGERSAERARDLGCDHVAAIAPDVRGLIPCLPPAPQHFLYLRGDHVAHDLPGLLAPMGHRLTEIQTYRSIDVWEMPAPVRTSFEQGHVRAVLFFSARSAAQWIKIVDKAGLAASLSRISALCLSDAVLGSVVSKSWADVQVAAAPHHTHMLALVAALEAPQRVEK